jgi:hypothetical protein
VLLVVTRSCFRQSRNKNKSRSLKFQNKLCNYLLSFSAITSATLELSVLSVQSALEHIEGEIIVVDNNSQDDSCEMMKQRFPNVKLIENKDNSVFRKGIQVSLSPKENTFASSILIPWLPKIL